MRFEKSDLEKSWAGTQFQLEGEQVPISTRPRVTPISLFKHFSDLTWFKILGISMSKLFQ